MSPESPRGPTATRWTTPSTSGTRITLSTGSLLEPGSTRFHILLENPPLDPLPVTVDLVSPEMPMHGVVRYEAEALDGGQYEALVDLPMEGYWELYVNLDYGADAALFELDVALPEGAPAHLHTGGSGHPAGHDPQNQEAGHAAHLPSIPLEEIR